MQNIGAVCQDVIFLGYMDVLYVALDIFPVTCACKVVLVSVLQNSILVTVLTTFHKHLCHILVHATDVQHLLIPTTPPPPTHPHRAIKHLLDALRPYSVENGGTLKVEHVWYVEGRGNLIIEYTPEGANGEFEGGGGNGREEGREGGCCVCMFSFYFYSLK